MSHFAVYVFTREDGRDVEDLLAPYDENIICAPYVQYTREQAIAKTRAKIEEYKNTTYAEYLKDPQVYKEKHNLSDDNAHLIYLRDEFPKKFNWSDDECYEDVKQYFNDDMIDENGNLLSTYNPDSKWDWYEVGGRWNNVLTTQNGTKTNEDLVSEIDWNETSCPFAFIDPIGRWYEKGEMGWWAIVANEKDKDSWQEEFKKAVKEYNDCTVTVVDCHI